MARFEIHHLPAYRASTQLLGHRLGLGEHAKVDTEAPVGRFGSGDGLKDKIHRGSPSHQFHRGGNVSQHARLSRNLVLADKIIQAMQ